jgi:hypothetical protein
MKTWLSCLSLTLCASVALAEPPTPTAAPRNETAALVEKELLAPMRKSESKRSRFSRAAPVAIERRVRVLDTLAQADARGKSFVRFAVDVRHPFDETGTWEQNAMVGCAYPDEAQVFVKRGEGFVTAKGALNGQGKAAASVCVAAPQVAVVSPSN